MKVKKGYGLWLKWCIDNIVLFHIYFDITLIHNIIFNRNYIYNWMFTYYLLHLFHSSVSWIEVGSVPVRKAEWLWHDILVVAWSLFIESTRWFKWLKWHRLELQGILRLVVVLVWHTSVELISLILDLVELLVHLVLVWEVLLEWLTIESILLWLERWLEVLGSRELELTLFVFLLVFQGVTSVAVWILWDARVVWVLWPRIKVGIVFTKWIVKNSRVGLLELLENLLAVFELHQRWL